MVLHQFFSKSASPDKDKDKDKKKDKDRKAKSREDSSSPKRKDTKSKGPPRSSDLSLDLDGITIPAPDSPPPTFSPSSLSSSPQKSASSSPRKSSPTKTTLPYPNLRPPHSRSSSTTTSKPAFFSSNRNSRSEDSHPLNLPPDELRRHLSAMAAARDDSMRSSMDIDRDTTASPQPEATPMSTNGIQNGDTDRSPTPPPHRSPPPNSDGGESHKLAGNKFYKQGDYERAIQEYNKG
jgi:DnaJ homolog subfamily C member 7